MIQSKVFEGGDGVSRGRKERRNNTTKLTHSLPKQVMKYIRKVFLKDVKKLAERKEPGEKERGKKHKASKENSMQRR